MRKKRKNEVDLTTTISNNIREMRHELGISQHKLSCRSGLTSVTIWNLEHMYTARTTITTLSKVAMALGVTLDEIVNDRFADVPLVLKPRYIKKLYANAESSGYGDDIEGYIESRVALGTL